MIINSKFPRYSQYDPLVPVWCVTPQTSGCIHRFFDTSPFSPSMKYMALLRLPQEERLPVPGEVAEIVLVNLVTGEEKVIADTRGWETQLGANINWGPDDTIYYNDVDTDTWEPFCVKLNPVTGEKKRLDGTIYRISPDGSNIISSCLKRMRRTQDGYGVVVPDEYVPRNFGFRDDDGLYITDTQSGKRRLLVSIRDVFERATPTIDKTKYEQGECYGFHCKYNPQGDKLIFSMRAYQTEENQPFNMMSQRALKFWVLTMNSDGSDIRVAVGPEHWAKGGHHINWFPDGRRLSMNLALDGDRKLSLAQVNYDGTNLSKIIDKIPGSGHPTVHPNKRLVLTDTYQSEPISFGDGTVPLRLVDLPTASEKAIVRINIANPAAGTSNNALRVDPHPAWAPNNTHIAFNGYVDGTRRVFVADLSAFV